MTPEAKYLAKATNFSPFKGVPMREHRLASLIALGIPSSENISKVAWRFLPIAVVMRLLGLSTLRSHRNCILPNHTFV